MKLIVLQYDVHLKCIKDYIRYCVWVIVRVYYISCLTAIPISQICKKWFSNKIHCGTWKRIYPNWIHWLQKKCNCITLRNTAVWLTWGIDLLKLTISEFSCKTTEWFEFITMYDETVHNQQIKDALKTNFWSLWSKVRQQGGLMRQIIQKLSFNHFAMPHQKHTQRWSMWKSSSKMRCMYHW